MAERVFVYGTLLLPVVQNRVTGRVFAVRPARLDGYSRRRVRGESYPSLRQDPAGSTVGAVLDGLEQLDLERIDAYEGRRYERRRVTVGIDDGDRADAWVWLLAPVWQFAVSDEPWDLACFERDDLARFLDEYEGLTGLEGW